MKLNKKFCTIEIIMILFDFSTAKKITLVIEFLRIKNYISINCICIGKLYSKPLFLNIYTKLNYNNSSQIKRKFKKKK